jgi:DNA-binding GntR family transcriptional regulator
MLSGMDVRRGSSSAVYDAVRADILAGRFLPGEHLPFARVCGEYDTSAGALREVLMRLAEQGLVRSEPQQGFSVAPVSLADLRELTEVRLAVEDILVRRAVAEGSVMWEADLLRAHHVMARTGRYEPGDPEHVTAEWVAAHAAFHGALLDGCDNNRFKEIARSARDAAELYRPWSSPAAPDNDRDADAEHADLLAAALDRDAGRAADLIQRHIQLTADAVTRRLEAAERAPEPETPSAPAAPPRRKQPKKTTRPATRGSSTQGSPGQRVTRKP